MDESVFDCSICQDKLSEAMETKCCHHCFCKKCIEDWLTRRNSCPSCRKTLTRNNLVPNVPIQRLIDNLPGECPNYKRGCTTKLTRGNINAHVQNSCEFVEVLCVNECGITVFKKDLVSHQRQTCSKRLIPCIQCTLMVALDKIPEHISSVCPKSRISCSYCKTLLLREKLLEHQLHECSKVELKCPFAQFGCPFKGLRLKYNAHMVEDADVHVGIMMEREARMAEEIKTLKNELERGKNNNNKPQEKFVFNTDKSAQQQRPSKDAFVFEVPQAQPAFVFGFGAPAQEQQPKPFGPNNNPFSFSFK